MSEAEYKKLTEDQISQGFKVVQEYYNLAGDAAKEEFTKTTYSAEEALDQIEEASYEYHLNSYVSLKRENMMLLVLSKMPELQVKVLLCL